VWRTPRPASRVIPAASTRSLRSRGRCASGANAKGASDWRSVTSVESTRPSRVFSPVANSRAPLPTSNRSAAIRAEPAFCPPRWRLGTSRVDHGHVVPIGEIGRIRSGKDEGCFVQVLDDDEESGGYVIHTAADPTFTEHAYDNWVENAVMVEQFFEEAGWDVDWTAHEEA
jgi:hypothetical protein